MGSLLSGPDQARRRNGFGDGAGPDISLPRVGAENNANAKQVNITGRTLQGVDVQCEAFTSDTLGELKKKLADQLEGKHWSQLTLSSGQQLFSKDRATLASLGIEDNAILNIVIGHPLPEWAADLGFERSHCDWLRQHFAMNGLETPDNFNEDDVIWDRLKDEYAARDDQKAKNRGWGHRLWLEDAGQPVGQVRAAKGSMVSIHVKGYIWNNNCDTCIQQCGLALNNTCVSELYNGVPSQPRRIDKRVQLTVPEEAGAYMLYRFGDLQYSFRAALDNFSRKPIGAAAKYPETFVGWLIVE